MASFTQQVSNHEYLITFLSIDSVENVGEGGLGVVGCGYRERMTERVMVKVSDRKSTVLKLTLSKEGDTLLPNNMIYCEITGSHSWNAEPVTNA